MAALYTLFMIILFLPAYTSEKVKLATEYFCEVKLSWAMLFYVY